MKTACSSCETPLEPHRIGKQRYCLSCHAEAEYRRRAKAKARRKRRDSELRRLRARVRELEAMT